MKKSAVAALNKRSGSLAYNRLDMQVSQVFHLAIELYDTSDYLVILDHADDITVYEDQSIHDTASFYQMKTNDDSITLSTALNEGWIAPALYVVLNVLWPDHSERHDYRSNWNKTNSVIIMGLQPLCYRHIGACL